MNTLLEIKNVTKYFGSGDAVSKALNGVDSLYSTVQMPKGIPVATFAIGEAGAANAALFAVAMFANEDVNLREKLLAFRKNQSEKVAAKVLPEI